MVPRLHRFVAAALATLLVVAMAVGAAHAATHLADADCAVCVLSHHAPALETSDVPVPAPVWRSAAVTIIAPESTPASARRTSGSRAPPRTPSTSISRDA